MKHANSTRWLAVCRSRPWPFSSSFLELIWISYLLSNLRFLCLLSGHMGPSFMLTIESRTVTIFWVCGPISLKHMCFQRLLLEPHLTTCTQTPYRCLIKRSNWIRHVYLMYSSYHVQLETWTTHRFDNDLGLFFVIYLDYKF